VGSGGTIFFASGGVPDSRIAAGGNTYSSEAAGGGQPHNNMQPYQVLNFFIKT
jgi:microcystin-dependent protein